MTIIINIINNYNSRRDSEFTSDFGTRREGELNNSSYNRCTVSDFGTRKEGSLINNKCECNNCRDTDFGSRKWSNVF